MTYGCIVCLTFYRCRVCMRLQGWRVRRFPRWLLPVCGLLLLLQRHSRRRCVRLVRVLLVVVFSSRLFFLCVVMAFHIKMRMHAVMSRAFTMTSAQPKRESVYFVFSLISKCLCVITKLTDDVFTITVFVLIMCSMKNIDDKSDA
jgi:hypothetical protein